MQQKFANIDEEGLKTTRYRYLDQGRRQPGRSGVGIWTPRHIQSDRWVFHESDDKFQTCQGPEMKMCETQPTERGLRVGGEVPGEGAESPLSTIGSLGERYKLPQWGSGAEPWKPIHFGLLFN